MKFEIELAMKPELATADPPANIARTLEKILNANLNRCLGANAIVTPMAGTLYTRDEIAAAVNAAADAIAPNMDDPEAYETSDTIALQSRSDLFVNLAMGWLEQPGASEDEIIEDCYSEDADTVRGWLA